MPWPSSKCCRDYAAIRALLPRPRLVMGRRLRDEGPVNMANMMPSRHGRRALVTRPRAEAVALAEALDRRGIEAIIEPLLDIHYRDAPAPDLADVQALLCTSANGVRALARRSRERGIALFAVGEATAARARAEGFAQVESARGDINDLARLARERLCPQHGRLLHIAGSDVRSEERRVGKECGSRWSADHEREDIQLSTA